ncbi:MAG: M15 family metallopeptidase [Clostridia bacterium]|nr:M15 family metallopeptidase [Clostridia bacterium]
MKRLFCFLLSLFLPCLCLFGCAGPSPSETETSPETTQGETETYAYKIDISPYWEALNRTNLLLANKTHPTGPDYEPEQIQNIPEEYLINHKELTGEKTMVLALTAMMMEMRADGIRDNYVTSAYRSYSYQENLYRYYINLEMSRHSGWTEEQAEELVLTYSAKPGTSEHQTGLCIDFMTTSMTDLDESYEQTAAFDWLAENAFRFGFILRYPKGKENITGYAYEPWHYRFVGLNAASAIHEGRMTLEEYLEQN